jgi:hypothetical protein
MDFKSIMYDLIVEEVKNKKLLNALHQKWNSQDDRVTPEITEFIFSRFMGGTDDEGNRIKPLKDQLNSLKRPEIVSFLQKYNGQNGRDEFLPNKLKDIVAYSFPQISTLFAQFGIGVGTKKKSYFFEDPKKGKKEWVEESKNLWFGDQFKIYDDGNGFRIYKPKTQRDAVSFGFYQYSLAAENFGTSNKWCVTNFKGTDSMSNLWQSYRSRTPARTFYFVIDETKSADNEFHLGALQKLENSENGFPFRLTNGSNTNHDKLISIDDPDDEAKSLLHIYPQLRAEGALDKLSFETFDESKEMDLKVDDLDRKIRRITEEPNSEYDFVIQDPELKRAYINRGNELHKIRSFNSLSDQDVRLYFEVHLDQGNPTDVIKEYDTFVYLLKKRSKSVSDYLVQRLERSGSSVGDILTSLMLSTFSINFISQQDKDIKVVQDNNSGKVGIFDAKRGSWSKLNNITYGPDYFEITAEQGYGVFDFNKDSEDGSSKISSGDLPPQYLLGVYSKSQSVDDNTNFYVLDPGDGSSGVLIFSHNTWKTQAEPAWIDLDSDDIDFDKDYDSLDDKSTGPIS